MRAMPSALLLRTDYSASDLQRLAKRAKDKDQSQRFLSLAAVLDGMSRRDAARIGGGSAIWKLLSEGWGPTPTSSQTGGSSSELAASAAVAASFNPNFRAEGTPSASGHRAVGIMPFLGI